MRKALVIGINHYSQVGSLAGCVNDAHEVKSMLQRHADGTVNFSVKLMTATGSDDAINRRLLKDSVQELFAGDEEVVLLYFAGHGHVEATGGYICASDVSAGDEGLSLADIMVYASGSKAQNKIVVLDSCHSGAAGESPLNSKVSDVTEGMTILTASRRGEYAQEVRGGGVFTGLLVDALAGAAANLVGEVTPGSVYAHIDQSLGPWSQRPVFKTNVTGFVSLRKVKPPLELADLQRIAEFFPVPGHSFSLDPSYEPEHTDADPVHTATFAILQKYSRVNLVVPEGAPHMYFAAVHSKACRLTALGEHYRRLVQGGLI